MDILKAFSLLDTEYQINIQGTLENPLFQANQIGKLLGIGNLSENLRDFDNEEKVLFLTHTLGGNQEMVFLTETGLYRVLGRSRKPIAHKFQKWMVSVLKEISPPLKGGAKFIFNLYSINIKIEYKLFFII